MSWTLMLSLVASAAGLVSGAWLCFPTAASNPHALAWVADPPYKSAEGISELSIAQSAQYWVGGLFLIIAFLLQTAAALISAQHQVFAVDGAVQLAVYGIIALFCFLIPFSCFSVVLYLVRRNRIQIALAAAAKYLAENRRVTPLP